jgi:hypothetical protein
MGRRVWAVCAALAVAAGLAAALAGSAGAGAGDPKAASLVLAARDLPDALVARQLGGGTSYERDFLLRRPYGASRLDHVASVAVVESTVDEAVQEYTRIARVFTTAHGSERFSLEFFGTTGAKPVARRAEVGDSGMTVTAALHASGDARVGGFLLFRIDRVIEVVEATGRSPAAHPDDYAQLGEILDPRVRAALAAAVPNPPVSTVAPYVTGSPQVGETLTLLPGRWEGQPYTYAYQWQRCDAAGESCVDLPKATVPSYRLQPADAGSTIRAEVTARNAGGETTAVSAPTAVVQ